MRLHPPYAFLAGMAMTCLCLAGCRSPEQILAADGEEQLRRFAYADAYATFTRFLSLYPQSAEAYFNRGMAATGLGRVSEALADFDQAIRLTPGNNVDARWMRYRIRKDSRDAVRMASGTQPLLRPVHQTMESALTTLMLEDLNKILDIDESDIAARYERGLLLRGLGRVQEAKSDFDIALSYAPRDVWILNERGRLMHDTGDYRAALEDYETALTICDTCTWLLYNKALSLKAMGQTAVAAQVLTVLVGADSLDGQAWLMLGECRIQLGQRGEACVALARSMALGIPEARDRYDTLCGAQRVGRLK